MEESDKLEHDIIQGFCAVGSALCALSTFAVMVKALGLVEGSVCCGVAALAAVGLVSHLGLDGDSATRGTSGGRSAKYEGPKPR